MPLSAFHPIVARWFAETLGTPTAAQRHGWRAIRERRHTLIAAPTGSGKTLAAFLTALDELFREGLRGPLPDEVRVVYVSPLKALSADIHKNLAEPRRGIRQLAEREGLDAPRITAAVRTGDTTQADRAAMLRTPPHILVTTPESLYLLLTAARGREMLRTVRTVIVDEIHAVIGTRRGAHLALTLERLQRTADAPLVRLGLSATQKPIDEVARFLVGTANVHPDSNAASARSGATPDAGDAPSVGVPDCVIVDEGHRRAMDLAIETPRSALEAVMSLEIWEEYYDRLLALIQSHRTTLIFVNTRRMAERLARRLSERLGEAAVTAHHGSLAKEARLDAEARLKSGQLQALVATASLELGIDIGAIDLVCQIGSPRRIATLLQRVGRSGHSIAGTPKGRVFPTSRDDLIECAALLRAVRAGELDRIVSHDCPLDVLAQQLVAESASEAATEDELFAWARRAWPYHHLTREQFDAVVRMTAEGFATRRGRRGALVHRDEVQARLRGRRGARQLAITSGGAIPEVADYRVLLEPEDTFIGTLNEDFAIESNAGDVFQLGNAAWRVLRVGAGVVRVADAKGAPPSLPFWLGEAPGRSDELSRAVSDLRAAIDRRLDAAESATDDAAVGGHARDNDIVGTGAIGNLASHAPSAAVTRAASAATDRAPAGAGIDAQAAEAIDWLIAETGLSREAAEQAIAYLADGRRMLGALPTHETLVLERFFDESGGMQLVLHAPFGSRVNKAWGLALRKRFCRQFNFELQAAATEDALLLSLGPQHSFPLADVFRYLHPASARDVLVQAFLDAPVFQTRWRWNSTIALAVPRNRHGRKVPPPLQRMQADDLMAAVFPDAAACLENIPGDRQVPDHPLVSQTIRDCLQEAMDFDGLAAILERIHRGELRLLARDTPEPSPLAHEILTARPYAFLDDAPLEERRAHAVFARRASDPASAGDLGALDAAAIERVRDEVRLDPRDADELHDALLTVGALTSDDLRAAGDLIPGFFAQLTASRRATRLTFAPAEAGQRRELWIAAERLPEWRAIHPDAAHAPAIAVPAARTARAWTREDAIAEIVRGRMTLAGPCTARELADGIGAATPDIDAALLLLEAEGVVLRGQFSPASMRRATTTTTTTATATKTAARLEWCDRALLARIHRYTLNRLRAEIEPVSPADFTRFLFAWQQVDPDVRLGGVEGLRAVVSLLDGFEAPAAAWEASVLPTRVDRYDASLLDMLCLTGEVGWARLSTPAAVAADTIDDRTARASAERAPGARDRGGRGHGGRGTSGQDRLASSMPIALFLREHGDTWQTLRDGDATATLASHTSTITSAATSTQTKARTKARTKAKAGVATRGATHGIAPGGDVALGHDVALSRDVAADGDVALGCRLPLSRDARALLERLRVRGASFSRELASVCAEPVAASEPSMSERTASEQDGAGPLRSKPSVSGPDLPHFNHRAARANGPRDHSAQASRDRALRRALCELVAAGLITSDGFAGVRGLIRSTQRPFTSGPFTSGPSASDLPASGTSAARTSTGAAGGSHHTFPNARRALRSVNHLDSAGRWSLLCAPASAADEDAAVSRARERHDGAIERQAWALLRRYGVVFRRLLTREPNAASWRDLTRVYRRLEARGEIRGGRFVAGMSGEQFALGDAVERLREVRRTTPHGRVLVISAADPLNLAGIVSPGDRIRAVGSTRIAYRDGVPLAVMEGDYLRPLTEIPATLAGEVASALAGRRVPPVISGYIGRTG